MKPTTILTDAQTQDALERTTHPRVTVESIEEKVEAALFHYHGQLTICIVTMNNGFMCVGKSAPASLENYNIEIGKKYAYDDCIKQLFVHEGYLLCEKQSSPTG